MGTHIEITERVSHPPSVVSEEDELQGTRIEATSPHISPQYSDRGAESQAGSSDLRDFGQTHLHYPHEIHEGEVHPSDSASGLDRHPSEHLRSTSSRRDLPRQRPLPRDPGLNRGRDPLGDTESVADSTVEYLEEGRMMPQPHPYRPGMAYTHSSSSGHSYGYPPMSAPPSNQMIHYAAQQQQMPMPYQYSQMASPGMYPPSHNGYPAPPFGHHPGSQISSGYNPSAYGQPQMMPYGQPPPGYFQPPYPQPYPQQYPHPQYMDAWRVNSPGTMQPQPVSSPPSTAAKSEPEGSKVDPDEIARRVEAMFLEQTRKESEERMKREQEKADAEKAALEAATAKAERAAAEARIREEAAASALKAAADAATAEAERAVREQKIREEAAEAALKAAAAAATAKAEAAARDAKIAEDAANAARTEAEKKAAEEAAKAKEESEAKQKEADAKLKEAEEAAAAAKKDAEEAAKKAEALAPPAEKKAPIRFVDAVGRKFNFPFEYCAKWRGMKNLIDQAFQHIENLAPQVFDGRFDLVGPDGEIILPALWDSTIEPDWVVTMHIWPDPEPPPSPPPPPPPPPPDDVVMVPPPDIADMMNMEDILNGTSQKPKSTKGGSKKGKSKPSGGGFGMWMLGGGSTKGKQSLKGDKKPELAAGSQHSADEEGACTVM